MKRVGQSYGKRFMMPPTSTNIGNGPLKEHRIFSWKGSLERKCTNHFGCRSIGARKRKTRMETGAQLKRKVEKGQGTKSLEY